MKEKKSIDGPSIEPISGKIEKIVIFLHGYGSNGEDLITIGSRWSQEVPNTIFYSPNAPFLCPASPEGFEWFKLFERTEEEIKKGLEEAGPYLYNFINEVLGKHKLESKDLLIVGFSQGTIMSLYHLNKKKNSCAGIIGYSGYLFENKNFTNEVKSKFPVFLYHGKNDEVINSDASEIAAKRLSELGFEVTLLIQNNLGHGIDENGLDQGKEFIKKVFKL